MTIFPGKEWERGRESVDSGRGGGGVWIVGEGEGERGRGGGGEGEYKLEWKQRQRWLTRLEGQLGTQCHVI